MPTEERWNDAEWVYSKLKSTETTLEDDAHEITAAFNTQAKRYNSGKRMYEAGWEDAYLRVLRAVGDMLEKQPECFKSHCSAVGTTHTCSGNLCHGECQLIRGADVISAMLEEMEKRGINVE